MGVGERSIYFTLLKMTIAISKHEILALLVFLQQAGAGLCLIVFCVIFLLNNRFYPFIGIYTTTSLPEGSQIYRVCSIWQKGAWP